MFLSSYATSVAVDRQHRVAWISPGDRRRMDPLTWRACQVCDVCLAGQQPDPQSALVFASAYGSVISTLRFADSIAQFGDAGASPTPFTSSVHNATAGALSLYLGLRGPSSTLSEGEHSFSAALRWAWMLLTAQRCPAVLLLCGDEHNAWSAEVVRNLLQPPWPVASGMAALLLQAEAPGKRCIRPGIHPAPRCLDNGGLSPALEGRLIKAAKGQERLCAPEQLAAWWPTCLAAALPLDDPRPLQLREIDHGVCEHWWIGPDNS